MSIKSNVKPLPDIIKYGLKVLFVGYNPGITSASTGHHYAHKSNRFWKLLYESGLTPERLQAVDDRKLLELDFGSTNIIDRPSKTESEIKPEEFRAGSKFLYKLISELEPRIVCYVGIGVYKSYASDILNIPKSKLNINMGLQPQSILNGIADFVCSNPSGLNTIPYEQQLSCFKELKNLSDNL